MKRRDFVKGVLATMAASSLPMGTGEELRNDLLIVERLNIASVNAAQTSPEQLAHLKKDVKIGDEPFLKGDWQPTEMSDLRPGDVFRMFQQDGTPVEWRRDPKEPYTICVATGEPYPTEFGVWGVEALPWDEFMDQPSLLTRST